MNASPPPLAGIRVFDLSQGVAGPYCTMLLAAQGADVIKVEPPQGDWIRSGHNRVRGHAPAAIAVNAGKRSIALDLKQRAACELAQRIALTCDIVVESFRPGVVDKFGLGADALRERKPELLYCSITGFGRNGPLKDRPVIDHIAQAYTGWMALNADAQGVPQRTRNVVLADQITGLYAYQAIASALIGRLRHGAGRRLEVTLAGAMAAFLAPRITSHVLSDGRVGNAEFTPPTGDYATRDGTLVIAAQKPADVERLLSLIGRRDLLEDERYATPAARIANAATLREALARTFATRSAREWEDLLADAGVMACTARTIGGFVESQQAHGLDLIDWIDLPELGRCPLVRVPGAPDWHHRAATQRPPRIGEHTEEILAELELDSAPASGADRPPRAG